MLYDIFARAYGRKLGTFIWAVFFVSFVGAVVLFAVLSYKSVVKGERVLPPSKAEIAIEQQYTAYYNGKEVDINKVDLGAYNASYNEAKREVYLSDKTDTNGSFGGGFWSAYWPMKFLD